MTGISPNLRCQTIGCRGFLLVIVALLFVSTCEAQEVGSIRAFDVAKFLKSHCLECHGAEHLDGGLDIQALLETSDIYSDQSVVQQILNAVQTELMPPEDHASQPNKEERSQFIETLTDHFKRSGVHGSTFSIRRLSQNEYSRTITSLFELSHHWFLDPRQVIATKPYFKPAAGKLEKHILALSYGAYAHRIKPSLAGVSPPPIDFQSEHGFTNEQSGLSTSPSILEKYLQIATELVTSPNLKRVSGLKDLLAYDEAASEMSKAVHGTNQLKKFLPRAFRRPLSATETSFFNEMFLNELAETKSYEQAIQNTLTAILVSPSFMFRDDLAMSSEGFNHHPQFAMASRLSYFLWGSMPDPKLFDAAQKGELKTDQQLTEQIERMMQDPRIENLSTDFASQWLRLQAINSAQPDKEKFPSFYPRFAPRFNRISESLIIEQTLLFEAVMIENRSILDLIKPDFVYWNHSLIKYYGYDAYQLLGYRLPESNYEDFFRIPLPDEKLGGILTSGAMLVSTSTPTRTSPVARGTWVLDVLFNRPPPPPPGAVPSIDSDEALAEATNIRDKLALHRQDKSCAVCHNRIDPYGLVFEDYDAIGNHRSNYEDQTAVITQQVIDGETIANARDLKSKIVEEKEPFVRGFVEHLLKYALGRPILPSDQEEVNRITKKVIADGCRFKSVIKEIVLSKLFRHESRHSESPVANK